MNRPIEKNLNIIIKKLLHIITIYRHISPLYPFCIDLWGWWHSPTFCALIIGLLWSVTVFRRIKALVITSSDCFQSFQGYTQRRVIRSRLCGASTGFRHVRSLQILQMHRMQRTQCLSRGELMEETKMLRETLGSLTQDSWRFGPGMARIQLYSINVKEVSIVEFKSWVSRSCTVQICVNKCVCIVFVWFCLHFLAVFKTGIGSLMIWRWRRSAFCESYWILPTLHWLKKWRPSLPLWAIQNKMLQRGKKRQLWRERFLGLDSDLSLFVRKISLQHGKQKVAQVHTLYAYYASLCSMKLMKERQNWPRGRVAQESRQRATKSPQRIGTTNLKVVSAGGDAGDIADFFVEDTWHIVAQKCKETATDWLSPSTCV